MSNRIVSSWMDVIAPGLLAKMDHGRLAGQWTLNPLAQRFECAYCGDQYTRVDFDADRFVAPLCKCDEAHGYWGPLLAHWRPGKRDEVRRV